MKKLLSVIFLLSILLALTVPAAADNSVETVRISESMTMQEFIDSAQETEVLGFSDSQSFNNTELHEKGYYYTHLLNQDDNLMQLGYLVAESGYTWKTSSVLKREAWVSNKYMDLDFMVGTIYNSADYQQKWAAYSQKIIRGAWACRYDNPADFDRFNNVVTIEATLQRNSQTNVVTNFDVYVVLEDHAYYQDSLITTRNNKVAQIVAQANKKSSQFEAVLYIHDYLINNAEYDNRDVALKEQYSGTEAFYYAHSSFGVLNNRLGVCESYAKAFKIICDQLDNPPACALITSKTHMWNIVLMNGKWYCLDATWDDPIGGTISDKYFLCGDPDVVDGTSNDHVPVTNYGFTPQYAANRYHNHSAKFVAQKNATEAATGVEAHYECTVCGMYFSDASCQDRTTLTELTIEKLPHTHSLKFVAQVDATETATGVKAHYKCTVCAELFTDANGKNATTLAQLTIPKLAITVAKPTISVKNIEGGVKISWNAVSKAEKYYIYRRPSTGAAWEKIYEATSVSYVDTAAISGVEYQYTVRAVRAATIGDCSNVATIKFLNTSPVTVKNAASGMAVSWNKVTGAGGYIVYRRQLTASGWSAWKKLGTTQSLSYADNTAVAGTDYQYTAIAYSGSYKAVGVASSTVRRLALTTVKTTADGNYLKTTWTKAAGAADYVVYRRQLNGNQWSGWKAIATVSSTAYTDKSVSSGVTYQYCVRARYGSAQSVTAAGNSVMSLAMPKVTVSASTTNVQVKWGAVPGASGYTVYRRQKTASGWSSWENLGNRTTLSYTDSKVTAGVQYQYTVRAYCGAMKSSFQASAAVCVLSTPKVTVANAAGGVRISWTKITGAQYYIVYRSTWQNGKWTGWQKYTTATDTGLLDKTVSSGTIYKYCVRAVSGTNMSGYQASASLKYLATPVVKAVAADGKITATWSKIAGASGYTVYRRQKTASGWSSWKVLGNQTALSYTDNTVAAGVEYQYTVRAYWSTMKSYFQASATVYTIVTPNVTVANGLNGVVAKWTKVPDATGYIVYRREYSNGRWGNWTRLTVTAAAAYTDTAAESGKIYQYTARAVVNGTAGGFKASATIMFLAAPEVTAYSAGVYWDPVEGAAKYYVYRRVWNGDTPTSWERIADVEGKYFCNDEEAQSGCFNEYTVRAVSGANKSAYIEGEKAFYLEEPDLALLSSNGAVNIRITPSEGASEYILFRNDGTGWREIRIGACLNYTDTDVVAGKTYQYFVQAKMGGVQSAPSTIRRILVK